ncbi:multidrug effflux MFS transporter [Aliiroseovarius sp. YM-037]|uniref:multidrug effflux MFS transporter n=1 Tax=Aliiroseovarius sp. YM-037 TaxID=3341728 RepID=UPI003A7FB1EE
MPRRLSTPEFIAMIAMLFATIAFSIDAMLPALPTIGEELTPDDLNQAQLVITSFVFGMGVGTLFTGPLSDAFGRKVVLLSGAALYAAMALLAWWAESLETLLAARALQGLGAAGPRVVALAIVRDLYSGRQMARIMSFVMLVFSLVPALAPSLGAVIIYFLGWRAIFATFVIFAAATGLWLALRQSETLPIEARIPFRFANFMSAFREVGSNKMFVLSVLVQTLVFGMLMSVISTTQQIYDVTFDEGARFPLWFGATAIIASSASLVNAALVVRLGMRYLISVALAGQFIASLLMAVMTAGGLWPDWAYFPAYFAWSTSIFFILGLTLGNLNALAMEPMGHIAGMAASIIGAVSTVLAVLIAVPIGLAFDGTPVPLAVGAVVLTGIGWLLMRRVAQLERVASST